MNEVPAAGKHCLLELYGCSSDRLSSEDFIEQLLTSAAGQSGATVLKYDRHVFPPVRGVSGITAVALLSESHISIHTWPETGYAAVDVFTCGHRCNPVRACAHIVSTVEPTRSLMKVVNRGPGSELSGAAFDVKLLTQEPQPA